MLKETMIASTVAMTAALRAVIEKYKLPADEVYKLAGEVFKDTMDNYEPL